ncbi:MAG: RDD family protein [Natronomonas sp.]
MVTFERPLPDLGTEGDVVVKRILAFLIDAVGFGLLIGIVSEVLAVISEPLGVLVGGLGTLLFFAYFIYFEAEYGQTVGKMVMDIVVVTEDGDPITYRDSAIRTLLRILDWFPYPLHIVGLVAIFVTDRKQRVGDLVADTIVVKAKPTADKL